MPKVEKITTADGSASLYLPELDETYHSRHGAVQESQYVFIEKGLAYYHAQHRPAAIHIFEVGYGTGLNVLLAAQWALQHQVSVCVYSLEQFPLAPEQQLSLGYGRLLGDAGLERQLAEAPWEEPVRVHPYFQLKKLRGDLLTWSGSVPPCQVVWFDAFAPSKQPELWSLEAIKTTADLLAPQGVWVTYAAQGQMRRHLLWLGLEVERLPGPPGKREMVRASKP